MSPAKETDIQESSFTQRLVGAMVLIALAVIIVPMVLDFRKDDDRVISGTNIPPKHENFRVEVLPLRSEAGSPVVAEIPDTPRGKEQAATEPPTAQVEGTVAADKEVAETMRPAAVAKESIIRPEIKVPRVETAPVHSKNQEVKKIISDVPRPVTWDIQVGSFSSDENAVVLRDRLREQGYSAFIDKATVEGQANYRVRVGPELSKPLAEKRRNQLAQELDLNGIVMVH